MCLGFILRKGYERFLGISTHVVSGCSTRRLGLTFPQNLRSSILHHLQNCLMLPQRIYWAPSILPSSTGQDTEAN